VWAGGEDARPSASEEQLRLAAVLEVAWRGVVPYAVDVRAEIGRRLPPEVVVDVRAVGLVNVGATEPAGPVALEEHPMAVRRECRPGVRRRCVDRRSQVRRYAPRGIHRGPL